MCRYESPSSLLRMVLLLCPPRFTRYKNAPFFFFNDTATTEIYTLSLHDALPICRWRAWAWAGTTTRGRGATATCRSEEHTSELQSRRDIVCRLLLEKKKMQRCRPAHRVLQDRPVRGPADRQHPGPGRQVAHPKPFQPAAGGDRQPGHQQRRIARVERRQHVQAQSGANEPRCREGRRRPDVAKA